MDIQEYERRVYLWRVQIVLLAAAVLASPWVAIWVWNRIGRVTP